MNICLFPGNFQPLHTGHMMVLQGMHKICSRAIVAICHGEESIFSKEQVREMISTALLDQDIADAEIHFVEDCGSDEEWLDKLIELGEGEDVTIWSGRPEVLELCAAQGVETKEIKHVPGFDSAEIRAMYEAHDKAWEGKVPPAVHRVLEG
jgi:cytidyltransferase-like protein